MRSSSNRSSSMRCRSRSGPWCSKATAAPWFAPTKNPTGVDSVESCREMLIERDAKRLEAAGVRIPRTADGRVDAKIELSPLAVFDDEDAAAYVASHGLTEIARGAELSLD